MGNDFKGLHKWHSLGIVNSMLNKPSHPTDDDPTGHINSNMCEAKGICMGSLFVICEAMDISVMVTTSLNGSGV